jgi:hypothetical protein
MARFEPRKRHSEMNIGMKNVRKLRVHWPVRSGTLKRLADGDLRAFEEDQSMVPLFGFLESSPELGDFGSYRQVFESSLGFECFTVAEGANPTLGSPGERTISPTFVLTTYFDADLAEEAVDRLLHRIIDVHPWEVPVVEISGPVRVSTAAASQPAHRLAS